MRNSTGKFKAKYGQSLIRSYSAKRHSPTSTQPELAPHPHLHKATSTFNIATKSEPFTPLPTPKRGQPKVEKKLKGLRQSQMGSRMQSSRAAMQQEEQTLLNRKLWGRW